MKGGMNELALFAGAGGGILGGHLLGWNTVCAVEWADYPRKVLLARQRDGILPRFPIWDDVSTFDGKPWRGRIDIISGGFPCQDISAAGKGAGITGERSGLWKEMARIIDEVRPRFTFVENSPMLTSRGLGDVLGDLAEMGYNARWCVLGADDAGGPHQRKRIWILAYSMQCYGSPKQWEQQEVRPERITGISKVRKSEVAYSRCEHGAERYTNGLASSEEVGTNCAIHDQPGSQRPEYVGNTTSKGLQRFMEQREGDRDEGRLKATNTSFQKRKSWWETDPADGPEPELDRVVNGVANRVDRLKAIGNGQVPAVAAIAFLILSEGLI